MITLHSHKDPGPAMNALVVKTMMIVTLKTIEMKTVYSWQHLAIWWRYYDYLLGYSWKQALPSLRLPLELLRWLNICDPMYAINPVHLSSLEMAKKKSIFEPTRCTRLCWESSCPGFAMFEIKKCGRKYASKTQESRFPDHLIFVTGTTPAPE